jgi:hypothetical protein
MSEWLAAADRGTWRPARCRSPHRGTEAGPRTEPFGLRQPRDRGVSIGFHHVTDSGRLDVHPRQPETRPGTQRRLLFDNGNPVALNPAARRTASSRLGETICPLCTTAVGTPRMIRVSPTPSSVFAYNDIPRLPGRLSATGLASASMNLTASLTRNGSAAIRLSRGCNTTTPRLLCSLNADADQEALRARRRQHQYQPRCPAVAQRSTRMIG